MVVDQFEAPKADRLLQALADATRRDIVRRAMHVEHSISALAAHYPMSFAAVQKHVALLARAGLVTKERRGREVLVRADIRGIRTVTELLDAYERMWRDRLDRFADVLDSTARDDMTQDAAPRHPSAHQQSAAAHQQSAEEQSSDRPDRPDAGHDHRGNPTCQ